MNMPTKEKILAAACTGPEAYKAISMLFPELFIFIKAGQLYRNNESQDTCRIVLVVDAGDRRYIIASPTTGEYLGECVKGTTKEELRELLSWDEISEPSTFKSWTEKKWEERRK